MEDFRAAFYQRDKDVEVLHEKQRRVAAMHMGGVAVECLLKAMICAVLPDNDQGEKEWYDKEERNNPGHTISNPGHRYMKALSLHNHLYTYIVKRRRHVLQWLAKVEYPEHHFIDIRYVSKEADDKKYKSWYDAYHKLVEWLLKQEFEKEQEK
jgi:hypothetical protein